MPRNIVRVQVDGLGIIAIPATVANQLANQGFLWFSKNTGWVLEPEFSDVALMIPGSSIMNRTYDRN